MQLKVEGWCVPYSIFNAFCYMVKARRPVRLAISYMPNGIDTHAQAQVQDEDGAWQFLTEIWTGQCMASILYHKNHPDAGEPFRYVGLMEFIREQIEVLGLQDLAGL